MAGWTGVIFGLFIAILIMWILRQAIIISNYRRTIKDARAMMKNRNCLNRLVSVTDRNLEPWRKLKPDASVQERNNLCLRILRENASLGEIGEEVVGLYKWIQEIKTKFEKDKISFNVLGVTKEEFDNIVKWFECNRL